jgi:hypothetical protein
MFIRQVTNERLLQRIYRQSRHHAVRQGNNTQLKRHYTHMKLHPDQQ